jgi:hypothetical protein
MKIPSAEKYPKDSPGTASIYVSFTCYNLMGDVTEETLRGVFEKYGEVSDVTMKYSTQDEQTGMQKGYGFVSYKEDYEGYAAVLAALGELANATVGNISYKCELSRASKVLLEQSDFAAPPSNKVSTSQSVGISATFNANPITIPMQKQVSPLHGAGNASNQHHIQISGADPSGANSLLPPNRLGSLSSSPRELWDGYNQSLSRTSPLFDDGYSVLHPSAATPRVVNNPSPYSLPPRHPMKSVPSFHSSNGINAFGNISNGSSGYPEYHAKAYGPPLRTSPSYFPNNLNFPQSQSSHGTQDHYHNGHFQHQFYGSSFRSGQDPFVASKHLPIPSVADTDVNGALFDVGPGYWPQRQTPASFPSNSSSSSSHSLLSSQSHSFKQQPLNQQHQSLLSAVIDRPALSGSTTPAELSPPSRISLSSAENHGFLPRQSSPFLDFDPVHSLEEYR